jgi:hypothetical protein
MNNQNEEIKNIIDYLIETKYSLKNMLNDISQKIMYYENKLFRLCNHEWEIDHSYIGEKTQYQCKFCKLYK